MPKHDQQQEYSITLGLDSASYDPFANPAVLPPNHPTVRPHMMEDSKDRSSTRCSPRNLKNASHDDIKPLAQGTKMKRSGSFKSFLHNKDTSKSPIKSPKKETATLEGNPLKKSKSATSLSALLSRPRSSKGAKANEAQQKKDKENQAPLDIVNVEQSTPIWAQFATTALQDLPNTTKIPLNDRTVGREGQALCSPNLCSPSKAGNYHGNHPLSPSSRGASKSRPKSENVGSVLSSASLSEAMSGLRKSGRSKGEPKTSRKEPTYCQDDSPASPGHAYMGTGDESVIRKNGPRVLATAAFFDQKTKDLPNTPVQRPASEVLDPNTIEIAFEALLDTRNVPLATRDKMRSLDTNIKANFIKQDKAGSGSTSSTEGLAVQYTRPNTGKRCKTDEGVIGNEAEQTKNETPKKSRPRSLTFTFSKGDHSPSKRQKSSSHDRTRFGEVTPRTSLQHPSPARLGHGTSSFGKTDKFALPEQVIEYLRQVQQPQLVEVGKIQKLRQLLRNETVGWVEMFIAHGGMAETVGLLYRTIAVEWRCVQVACLSADMR